MKILIADDDPVSRRLLEATLVRFGHEVVAVADGREAVDTLLGENGPRLAILDWMMPKADGLTVCRTMRARSVTYVYIILLTTRDRREDMMAALDAEADDFLTKPFDVVELGARIRSGGRVLKLQEDLNAAQMAFHHEATHDRLTGLWNRGRILDQLGRELIRARREHRPLSVLIADIDHFKRINDTHGHQVGDEVLRQVAERSSGCQGVQAVVVPQMGPEHTVGEAGVILQPAGKEFEQQDGRFAFAALDSRHELIGPLAHRIMLLLVPCKRGVLGRAHQAFLIGEVIFRGGDQGFQ